MSIDFGVDENIVVVFVVFDTPKCCPGSKDVFYSQINIHNHFIFICKRFPYLLVVISAVRLSSEECLTGSLEHSFIDPYLCNLSLMSPVSNQYLRMLRTQCFIIKQALLFLTMCKIVKMQDNAR